MLSTGLLVLLGLAGSLWAQHVPPTVVINLDLSPEQRWKPLQDVFDINSLKKAAGILMSTLIPKWMHQAFGPLIKSLEKHVSHPYIEEIHGIARWTKINPADILILNYAYEFTAYCTSIVAQDRRGYIYHGRNFDYSYPVLRDLTMNVVFFKNGKAAYCGTTFAGYVGLWTGMSPYKFTVSGNQRESEALLNMLKNDISALLSDGLPASWVMRETLEEARDFQDAVLRLSKPPLTTGVYYIVAGVRAGEGVVITRDRKGPADIWPLDPSTGGWYRVQTNFDHWLPPLPSDRRREAAMVALNKIGQASINMKKLHQVLALSPVCDRKTIYTTLMSAAYPREYTTLIIDKGCHRPST
ncbi:PREDICTED: N-acylethanolamine-hydrolyzing acid amidase [Cyprinodon variegatus]|uniref:N-acylethanolamine-hydrolyzing acid amidase n=1 Tax=Cyprinodon variegatus TaxID=28743 RepID=UPI000742AD88|nr:PREDICTED: N-acylethanolamine-hydrolyzing acid amidase [Cyprinodon variegatus]